jgi:uncharacterized Zn-binding protein involved in type VI secretion
MPAWRALMDQHACPLVSVSGADGVGMVMMGSPTVLIDYQMACRMGDFVVEIPGLAMGPMNPIVLGCPTVMIGEAGSPSPGAGGLGGIVAGLAAGGVSQLQSNPSVYSKSGSGPDDVKTSSNPSANTPQERLEIAQAFYEQTGWSQEKIANHLLGIDFNHPVEIVTLHAGDVVKQWVDPNKAAGNYFDADAQPEELGLYPGSVVPRELKSFVVSKETTVLKSTAARIRVDWLKGVPPVVARGGAQQYFSLPKDSSNFVPGGSKL